MILELTHKNLMCQVVGGGKQILVVLFQNGQRSGGGDTKPFDIIHNS